MKKGLIIGVIVLILVIIIGVYIYSNKIDSSNVSDCTKAGKVALNDVTGEFKECCSDLKEVGNLPDGTLEECKNFAEMEGFGSICSDCGNSVCESWENRCNCPVDCK